MITPDGLQQTRRALGQQLANLRKAVDLTQHQLADAVYASRSSIAGIETGRQNADRDFWTRADHLTHADGALLTAYDHLRDLQARHARGNAAIPMMNRSDEAYLGSVEREESEPPAALAGDDDHEPGASLAQIIGTIGATQNYPVLGGSLGEVNRRTLLTTLAAISAGELALNPSRSLLRLAAQDSAVMASVVNVPVSYDRDLNQLQLEMHRLTTAYVQTSDLPRVLVDALMFRDQLSSAIETLRLLPRLTRELYVLMGATCLLLASISHDLGESGAGVVQVRAAETFAKLAEHRGLLAWSVCTNAMIDLWDDKPYEVLKHVARGQSIVVTGPTWHRLQGLKARALANMGLHIQAEQILNKLEERVDCLGLAIDGLEDLGPMFSFPRSRWNYYAVVIHSQLGNYGEAERRVIDLGHGEQSTSSSTSGLTAGTWPVSWALARSNLALASLKNLRSSACGPERAALTLSPILDLPRTQRIRQVDQVFEQIEQSLTTGSLAGNSTAIELLNAVRVFRSDSNSTATGGS